MMQVTVRDIEGQRKEARVEVEWEALRADHEDLVSEYAKLPVPGFRQGKAPNARVEGHYRKSILEDLTARCVQRFSRQAFDGEGIRATGPVSITDVAVEYGEPFRFTVEFTELPEFHLPDCAGYALTAESDAEMRDELSERLLSETVLEVPAELIRQELSFDGREGVSPDGDEWVAARRRVKLLLILDKIAREDGIEVDEQDLEERIGQIASAHGTEPASLRQHLMRSGGLSRISRFLLAERTLDYLIERCNAKADTG